MLIAANAAAQPAESLSSGEEALSAAASQFGRVLHHVPGDNKCQFHALLHALNEQLTPPRATQHDVDSIRAAFISTLDNVDLLDRAWLNDGDSDRASITRLRDEIEAQAARLRRTVPQWFACMRLLHEWGDGGTLIAAALHFRVRVHVISTMSDAGVFMIDVPVSFGVEFSPTADIWLAVQGDRHYFSTRRDIQLEPPRRDGPRLHAFAAPGRAWVTPEVSGRGARHKTPSMRHAEPIATRVDMQEAADAQTADRQRAEHRTPSQVHKLLLALPEGASKDRLFALRDPQG